MTNWFTCNPGEFWGQLYAQVGGGVVELNQNKLVGRDDEVKVCSRKDHHIFKPQLWPGCGSCGGGGGSGCWGGGCCGGGKHIKEGEDAFSSVITRINHEY